MSKDEFGFVEVSIFPILPHMNVYRVPYNEANQVATQL